MQANLEVFYGENIQQKIDLCAREFQRLYADSQNNLQCKVDPIFYKALNRVLNDDYKQNPELVRQVLKCIHVIMKNTAESQKLNLISESSIDEFLWTSSKIFVWEFKRLDRIYKRLTELGPEPSESTSKTIKAMNMNIQKQCKIFTLTIIVYAEYWSFLESLEFELSITKKKEFKDNLINFNMLGHLVRFFDYEDQTLLKSITNFLIEVLDERIAVELINKGILQRLYRFLHSNQLPEVYMLVNKLFISAKCRAKLPDHKFFIKGIVLALERNQIANALVTLNLLSLDKPLTPILKEYELDLYLLNLVSVFFKKEDNIIEKKRVLWNLLINLSTTAEFANSFLRYKHFKIIMEFLFRTNSETAFKFIDNTFYFCNDDELKASYGQYTEPLLEYLESSDSNNVVSVSSCLNALSEIYNIKERKAITHMMKLLKKQNTHPNIFISSFYFLNKALYEPHMHKDLISNAVVEHVTSKFIEAPIVLEDEVRFQLLFFLYNLNRTRANSKVTYEKFLKLIDGFESVNIRLLGLVLNVFDLYIASFIHDGRDVEEVRNKKIEFFTDTLICLNEGLTPRDGFDDQYSDTVNVA